jgi:hypothetical protein
MKTNPIPIDISNMPDLMRLAEEVEVTKRPHKLIKDKKTVAILMPIDTHSSRKKERAKTEADYEAFLSAAGGWKDVDTDKFVANIYATRRLSNRTPVNI